MLLEGWCTDTPHAGTEAGVFTGLGTVVTVEREVVLLTTKTGGREGGREGERKRERQYTTPCK